MWLVFQSLELLPATQETTILQVKVNVIVQEHFKVNVQVEVQVQVQVQVQIKVQVHFRLPATKGTTISYIRHEDFRSFVRSSERHARTTPPEI